MKKTNLTRSLAAACSVVALSAVMYGCSSSGEDRARMDAEDYKAMLEAERDAHAETQADLDHANANAADLQTQLDTANANAADLQTQLDTANANAADLQTQLDTANANAADLQMQLDTATGDTADLQMQLDAANANAADLQTQLDAANANAADLQTQLDTANANAADLQTQLDAANTMVNQLQMQLDEAEEDRARKDRIARGGKVSEAIVAGDVTAARALPEATNVNATGITAERMNDGSVTVIVNVDNDDDFSGGTGPADSSGWTMVELKRDNDGADEDVIVVYTDVGEPPATSVSTQLTGGILATLTPANVALDDGPEIGRTTTLDADDTLTGDIQVGPDRHRRRVLVRIGSDDLYHSSGCQWRPHVDKRGVRSR